MLKSLVPLLLVCCAAGKAMALPIIEQRDQVFVAELSRYQQDSVDVFADDVDPNLFWWAPFHVAPRLKPGTTRALITYKTSPAPSAIALVTFDVYDTAVSAKVKEKLAAQKGLELAEIKLQALPLDNLSFELLTDRSSELPNFLKDIQWTNDTDFLPATVPLAFPLSPTELQLLKQKAATFIVNGKLSFLARRLPRALTRGVDTACVNSQLEEPFYVLDDSAAEVEYAASDLLLMTGSFQYCVTSTSSEDLAINQLTASQLRTSWQKYLVDNQLIEILPGAGTQLVWKVGAKNQWEKFFSQSTAMFELVFPLEVGTYEYRVGTMIRQK